MTTYYQRNKIRLREYYKNYYQIHKEKIQAQRSLNRIRMFSRDPYKYTRDIYKQSPKIPSILSITKQENLVVSFN